MTYEESVQTDFTQQLP